MTSVLTAKPLPAVRSLQRLRRWAESRWVVIGLIAAMVAVWGVEHLVIGQVIGGRRIGYLAFGALPNATVIGRGSPAQWWRYVSDALVHDVDSTVGLGLNAALLLAFGGHVERLYGRRACLVTLAVASACGGLTWLAWTSLGLVSTPDYTQGASSAACGLIGLLLAYSWRHRATAPDGHAGPVKAQAALGVGVVFLLGLVYPHVNNASHAGGLLGGLLVGAVLPPRPQWGGRRRGRLGETLLSAVVGVAGVSVGLAGVNLIERLLGH